MTTPSPVTAVSANSGTASPCSGMEASRQTNSIVMRVARSLWPSKTALELARYTEASERLCRYWLANRYSLAADDLAALLRTDHGLHVLEAVMGDAKPKWWRRFRRASRLAALRQEQAEQLKKIEQLELELD